MIGLEKHTLFERYNQRLTILDLVLGNIKKNLGDISIVMAQCVGFER